MSKNIKIFTYGSLREGFFNYNSYLSGKVISTRIGKLKNADLYHMPYKGYPAILPGTGEVIGEVMEIKDYENVMKAIDKMEGFISEGNPNNEYNKKLLEVEFEDGTKEKCYVYCYNKANDDRFEKEAILISGHDWKEYMENP
ncbi:MAG: gamma-glutamylcyclotransferase [Clostridiales bacterium]|jgi:gamma-glutamylcyclotransferase (GGCT)/AIG2-like uncharacterized protein YtfP|nr:gamma-glutamylcyclotransferase [Clostridiales bacterium]